MSAASARAALIDLASLWRREGLDQDVMGNKSSARTLAECARELDEATITHLSSSVTTDQSSSAQLERTNEFFLAVSAFMAAMASEGVPWRQAARVVNIVQHGHPDGAEAARITGRTTERPDQ